MCSSEKVRKRIRQGTRTLRVPSVLLNDSKKFWVKVQGPRLEGRGGMKKDNLMLTKELPGVRTYPGPDLLSLSM